jgi:hypothetical protein
MAFELAKDWWSFALGLGFLAYRIWSPTPVNRISKSPSDSKSVDDYFEPAPVDPTVLR